MKSSHLRVLNIISQLVHIPCNYIDNEFTYTLPSRVKHKTLTTIKLTTAHVTKKLAMELSNLINIYKKNLIIVIAIHMTPSSY